ncbi:MAG: rod shape-determining protein RodA [Proteobacteria bacterium]|nr:MAG: rod shape-determining protein RodA [Pseudomonadota bacterium]
MIAAVRLALALCAAAPLALLAPSAARADHHEQHEGHGAVAPQQEKSGESASAASAAALPRTPRPADAKLYIISPKNGETVSSPVTVRFGVSGMGVAPAGVGSPNTGHHHLLIDTPLPDFAKPIPNDAKHVHFGGGQTETTVELAPGEHRVQLLLGDLNHVPHDPPLYSDVVTFTVQ